MKALYKMDLYCGRMGNLEGLFIEDVKFIDFLIENIVIIHWGEVLGKHSDVYAGINHDEIKLVTTDEKVLQVIEEFDLENGYSPRGYLQDCYHEQDEDYLIENIFVGNKEVFLKAAKFLGERGTK